MTKSTPDVELVALDIVINEIEWLRELLMDLLLLVKPVPQVLMYWHNQTMLAYVMNTKDNSRHNKHIKHRLKTVRK